MRSQARPKTLAGTGHRPNKLGGYKPNPISLYVRASIAEVLQAEQPDEVISGMALGFDMWLAEIAIEQGIPLIAAMPFIEQASAWPIESQRQHEALLAKAKKVISIVDRPAGYAAWKMHRRNEWMVDHCDVLLACYDGSQSGGTFNCLQYAQRKGVRIIEIDPRKATL
jgi:uncharacterized phage-like protein YoqJ